MDVTGIPEGFELVEEPQDEVIDITVEEDKQPPTNVPEGFELVEDSSEEVVEEESTTSTDSFLDSPYFKDRKLGEFVVGRDGDKIVKEQKKKEDKTVNENYLKTLNYVEVPGQDFEFKQSRASKPDVEESYLDGEYNNLVEQSSFADGKINPSFQLNLDQWFQTNEGSAWWEENWYNPVNPYVVSKQGLKEDIGYQTGSSVLSKVNLLAGKVLMQDESASLEDQVAKNILQDTENSFNPLIQKGISYGGSVNNSIALNNKIGEILSNKNVDALDIVNPNNPSELSKNYELPAGVLDKAKKELALENAEAASKYQDPIVAKSGYHQREIIKLSTNNPVLNPLNLGVDKAKTLLDNQKQIKFHEDEINKLKQEYFKDEENGIPSQWYDPLSGSMVKRSKATDSQTEEVAERIAAASEKWGDTNIETLYEKENEIANEVIYLAKTAFENFENIENDVSVFNVGRQITMMDNRYQKMLSNQYGLNTLSEGLMYLPGSNVIAKNFNAKLDELLQIQKAIDLNFKPTDLDVPDYRFFDYLSSASSKKLGNLGEDNEAVRKTNEALNFIDFTEQTVGSKKTEELKKMWEPGMSESSANAIVDGIQIAGEFILARKIAGKTPAMVKDGVKGIANFLGAEGRVAKGTANILGAIGEEAYVIELRNQAVRPLGEEPMSKLFALGAGTAGTMVKQAQNTLLKSQSYRNLITTINKSKVAQNVINGTVQPVVGTFNIIAGQVGERSILEDITLKEAFEEATEFENFVNTLIMVKSAGAVNPVRGITKLYDAGVNDFYSYKGRINKEANKAAKILGFEGSFTGENVLQNKEINSKATSLRNKEGLNKPDSELTEEQVKRKNDIRNSVKSLKDQILYKETSDFIKSTYGKNEYANLYTTGRMLANGQEPTPQMKLSIANMSSLNQAYSVIADPNGPFVKNKRLETDVMNYVSRYKNFIDGVRRTGKTANDPRKEAKLIEKFDAYQSEIAGPLAILEAAKKTAKGEDLKSIKEKISDLEIKQQEYVDGINLDLQEYTTKRRKQIRGKVADIINKQDVVKYEVLSNEEFLKRFKEKGTEGLFVNDRGEMFVNEDYAKEINNVSVDSHELLHPAMNVTLNKLAKNGKLKPFIDEFKSSLPANVLAEAKRIIDERADITDKDYTREWFNVVSDVLQSGRIKVTNTRSNMQRLADTFTEFFKTETPMKDVDFETGNEAYEFIKRYSKTFREGKTDAPLEEAVVSKLKRFEKSEGTERSAEEKMSEDKINKFTKTKQGKPMTRVEWFEFTGKMNDKGELINQNKIGNAFEGLINSKIKGDKNKPGWIFGDNTKKDIIDDFKFRLRKRGFYDKKIEEFNPEVNDNFSGYMAGIINNVYKDILAANTKKVKTTSLDKQQEIMQREGKEMASSDMSAEDLTDISLEKDRQAKAKEQEPKETTASKIGMPKEVKTPSGKVESNEYIEKVVNEINFKDLKDITTEPGPNQTISPFLSNLKAKVATDGNVKKDISQGMGRAKERASYLETNFEKLAKSLDPTYFSGLIEREISKGKKVTLPKGLIQKDIGSGYTSDWYGKKAVGTKAAKTGITSGLKRIRLNPDFNFKNKANAKIFADAFKSQGRYEGLAGQIGAKAVIDVVEKSLGTGNKVDTKIKDIYEIQGRDLPADYAKNFREQILKASIERSRTPEEELSLKSTIEEIKKANKKTLKTGDTSVIGKMRDRVRKYGATPITTGKVSSDRIIEFFTGDGLDVFANLLYQAKGKRGKFQFLGSNVMSNAGNLLPSAIKNLFPAVGSYEAAVKAKMKSDGFSRKQAEEFYKDLKVAIEAGEILETSKLQQLVKETLGDKVVFSEEQLEQLNYALDNQTASKLQSNIKNIKNIIKGKNQLLDLMKEAFDKNNKNIDVLSFISYHAKSNTNPFRNFATVLGKESGKIFNNKGREDVGYEEHTLPFGEFANMMIEGLSLDAKAFEGMKKWINENYFQEAIDYETTRAILDQKTRSLGKDGKELPKWFSKQEMHPLLAKHISEALKGQRAWSEVVSADIRKYNEYATDPDLGYINPNKLNRLDLKTGKVISDAKRYNVEVDRFLQNNPRIIEAQNDLIYKQLIGEITPAQAKQRLKYIIDALGTKKADLAFKETKKEIDQPGVLVTNEKMTTGQLVTKANKIDKALDIARSSTVPIKKIRVFDFDDTVGTSNNKVFADKDGKRKILNAEEFAKNGLNLIDEGWTMDFSDFNKVTEGGKGPLFDLMKTMEEAKGKRDIFILTARAPEAAPAIYEFLKESGINIPLENITGLGNSTGEAKAQWLVNKAAEGYNDFYFADDAMQNVAAVKKAMSVLDVKSKVQQALMQKSETLSEDFNKIIEESTGIGAEKVFSDVKAQVRGGKKKGQRFFIPPSAEDFLGLVYTTLGKGKKGEAGLKFYQENLFDPYTRAMENLSTDRVNLMADFKELKKELDVPKDLQKTTESGFTNEQAVRVHLWNKMGEAIPGLSKTDLKELNDIVEKDAKLKVFADQILSITKGDGYSTPKESWAVGTITTDLIDVLNTKKRSKYLETWTQNKDLIYSKENLNKLEAAYGRKYREAVENSLSRMKSGSNRVQGGNRLSNQVLDYINNSTGAIMFFNTRSAVLQTLSAANFVNWSFNNPFKAGKAFANQPQYWKDFTKLMNSDYLKDRRNGLKLNINESEIANAAKTSKNKAKAALNYILEKGYLPTKYADSFAIASGGAAFYRNRINDLIKNEGKTEVEAEAIAMKEFRQVSEISQQSSDPSKISSQQASDLGRVVLQFANTPMQYARIQKRAVQDLVNRRGDDKTNISKIAYYGFLQNMLFNGLQQAVTSLGFGDEEMTDAEEKKLIKAANGMLDSSLRGLGLAGVTAGVLKNLGIDIYERSKRKTPDFVDSYKKLLEFSPAIKSKLGKFQSAAYPFDSKKRRAEVFEKGFSLDNPAYESMAKVITGTTNLPLDRLYSKVENLKGAMDEETETWQSIAMVLGWPEWQIKSDKKTTVPLRPQTEKQLKRKSKFKSFKVGDKSKTKTSRKSRFK